MAEGITQKIPDVTRPTDNMEFRVKALEKHDQLRKISSRDGSTYFDTENGDFVVDDGMGGQVKVAGGDVKVYLFDNLKINITPNGIVIYDSSGTSRALISDSKVKFYDVNGDEGGYVESAAGGISVTSSNNGNVVLSPNGTGIVSIGGNAEALGTLTVAGYTQVTSTSGLDVPNAAVFAKGMHAGTSGMLVDGSLTVKGTKNFKVDHPTDQAKDLIYVCPESPEVLIMCRGNGEVVLPQHFIDMAEPGSLQTITGVEGNWLVTGIRKGYADFKPEQPKEVGNA